MKKIIMCVLLTSTVLSSFAVNSHAADIGVVNACGIENAAKRMAVALKNVGFDIRKVAHSKKTSYMKTIIYYKSAFKDIAEKIEAEIPNVQNVKPMNWESKNDIIIIVGANDAKIRKSDMLSYKPPATTTKPARKTTIKTSRKTVKSAKKEVAEKKDEYLKFKIGLAFEYENIISLGDSTYETGNAGFSFFEYTAENGFGIALVDDNTAVRTFLKYQVLAIPVFHPYFAYKIPFKGARIINAGADFAITKNLEIRINVNYDATTGVSDFTALMIGFNINL